MDQRFVNREERRNVVMQKHIIRQQHEEPVELMMVMQHSPDEFPELYHLNMPTHHHHQQEHHHYRPSKYISNIKDYDTSYHQQVRVCQRPPVTDHVQNCYVVPPEGQNQKVFHYPGIYHHQPTQPPPPPPPSVKKPAPGKVIDSNEAAKLYGGILIRDFGRRKLPVRF